MFFFYNISNFITHKISGLPSMFYFENWRMLCPIPVYGFLPGLILSMQIDVMAVRFCHK